MSEYAQWWLVISRPSAEMILPVHPKSSETTASDSWAPGASASYICLALSFSPLARIFFSRAEFMAFMHHIPSSANAPVQTASAAKVKISFFISALLFVDCFQYYARSAELYLCRNLSNVVLCILDVPGFHIDEFPDPV